MSSDGKQLEGLIAFVERIHLPEGFAVQTNTRVFNDDGVQIAEFDIEIRGKVGSTEFVWLIECRDRPGSGPAPGSWIEQLVGRRDRFGFNKVTAVSTSGFAAGAVEYAARAGIELREVASLVPEAFSSWLGIRFVHLFRRHTVLESAWFRIHEHASPEQESQALSIIRSALITAPILRVKGSEQYRSILDAFSIATNAIEFEPRDLPLENAAIPLRIHANYKDDDCFTIETGHGAVQITSIEFGGTLRNELLLIPISEASEYKHSESGEVISQSVSFAQFQVGNQIHAFELHKISATGKTHVILRRKPNCDETPSVDGV